MAIHIIILNNACKIDRNEPKTVEQFFKSNIAVIQAFEY